RHEVAVLADTCWKCRLAPWGVRTDQGLREKRATKANSASGAREIRELKATVSHLSPEEARRVMIERLGFVPGESNYDDDLVQDEDEYYDEVDDSYRLREDGSGGVPT